MYYSSRAVVIKNRDLKETDALVTLFTEKQGKFTAVAKGVKRAKSSLRACVQPFCQAQFYFYKGKSLDLITQGKLLSFYGNSRQELQRTLWCMYMMEILDKSLLDRVPMPGLYTSLCQVLDKLNEDTFRPLWIRFFEVRLLINLGYQPVIDQCVECGSTQLRPYQFSVAEGGLLCSQCAGGQKVFALSGESLALLRLMIQNRYKALERVSVSPGAEKQVERFLEQYLQYHLERRFHLKDTMSILKKRLDLSIDKPSGGC